MFEYVFKDGTEVQILTPFCTDMSQVDVKTSQTADVITSVSVYPNGFKIETTVRSGEIHVKTNKELIDNGDGTMNVRL